MTRVLAFYLPQFHPIVENDEWWGAGFTDWTNVSQARPRFVGHHQPHVPAELGYYDLRVAETRREQARLAAAYGIDGFCYYHYWFNGKMLLDRPFKDVLASNEPDFPFCLCWANENWTRAWDGLEREVLIKQEYTESDSRQHIEWLMKAFQDERYIKVCGRPLLLIYRVDNIPNVTDVLSSWRRYAKDNGFKDLYICAMRSGFAELGEQGAIDLGFDAIVDFQPNRRDFPVNDGVKSKIYRYMRRVLPDSLYQRIKLAVTANNTVNYKNMVDGLVRKTWPTSYRKFPCVFPSWDNSARRKSATIIQNNEPAVYGKWLEHAINMVQAYPEMERFVFVNAWNEWAEGCHLEPDLKNGRSFLEQTRMAIEPATVRE